MIAGHFLKRDITAYTSDDGAGSVPVDINLIASLQAHLKGLPITVVSHGARRCAQEICERHIRCGAPYQRPSFRDRRNDGRYHEDPACNDRQNGSHECCDEQRSQTDSASDRPAAKYGNISAAFPAKEIYFTG
jgi:hypothetical protein